MPEDCNSNCSACEKNCPSRDKKSLLKQPHKFSEIKKEFDNINLTLLKNWEGNGKTAYKRVSDHITEKVADIESVLTTINDKVLKDIISEYKKIDKELGNYNRTVGNNSKSG